MGNRAYQNLRPRLVFSPESLARIEQEAISGYPEEVCGLLLGAFLNEGNIRVERIIRLPNEAAPETRRHRYQIAPRLLLQWDRIASAAGQAIVGFFHSHPDHEPRPSATDAALAWPMYAYLIAGVTRGGTGQPIATGMAAWTFDESCTSFRELSIDLDIDPNEIEYYI